MSSIATILTTVIRSRYGGLQINSKELDRHIVGEPPELDEEEDDSYAYERWQEMEVSTTSNSG